jgi:membrane-bound inhibitor of C-type lysozyme
VARPDHGGGYYCYADQSVAVDATERGDTFSERVSEGKSLVLCQVEIAGGRVVYDSGKMAVSRLRVLSEIGPVTLNPED